MPRFRFVGVSTGAKQPEAAKFFRVDQWDAFAARHLQTAVAAIELSGFVDVVREEARQLWRANCERHEPEQLFDDAATLGFASSRNVLNAVREIARSEQVAATALDEFGVPVFSIGSFDIRLFKTGGAAGRRPRMQRDFDWSRRESRAAAAARNDRYRAPLLVPGIDPLFEIPRPDAAEQVGLCREIFVFWGGDIESRLTAGWAGLPTAGKGSWLAVQPLWWDETLPESAETPIKTTSEPEIGIGGKPVPVPVVRLRRQSAQTEEK